MLKSTIVSLVGAFLVSPFLLAASLPVDLDSRSTTFAYATSAAVPNTTVRYLKNSGVCETTHGVNTYSGYVDVESGEHMWFWFFEARKNPETADFVVWFNGGPGCSSMIGLFQENGPCKVNDDNITTTLNPYSWNEVANVIYVDQPIGTGFSYGKDPVDSTTSAAPYVYKFFQILFANSEFSKYQSRSFGLFTESYGGHYGPAFSAYFEAANHAIEKGLAKGVKINLVALGINNAWIDPLIQNGAYANYSYNNGYYRVINESVYNQVNHDYNKPGGCKDQEIQCYKTGSNSVCEKADNYCSEKMFDVAIADRDSYYILSPADDPYPPENYVDFLTNPTIMKKIGAESTYGECPDPPYNKFATTGDDARTVLPVLEALVKSGLRITLWAGELDYNCNWFGMEQAILAMSSWSGLHEFASKPYTNLSVNGAVYGVGKNVGNFSFARVHNAGHEVPYYQPKAALQVFMQTLSGKPLTST